MADLAFEQYLREQQAAAAARAEANQFRDVRQSVSTTDPYAGSAARPDNFPTNVGGGVRMRYTGEPVAPRSAVPVGDPAQNARELARYAGAAFSNPSVQAARPAAVPGVSGTQAAPAAPATPAAPAEPPEGEIRGHVGGRIKSPLDFQEILTGVAADVYGSLGHPRFQEKAMKFTAAHMDIAHKKTAMAADKANEAILAGNVGPFLDVMNERVPNGIQYTSYSKNPDGTYTFKTDSGDKKRMSPADMMQTIAIIKNQKIIEDMMKKRDELMLSGQNAAATAAINKQGAVTAANVTGLFGLERERMQQQGAQTIQQMKEAAEMRIAKYKIDNPALKHAKWTVDALGNVRAESGDGRLLQEVEEVDKVAGGKRRVLKVVPLPPGGPQSNPVRAQAPGAIPLTGLYQQ